MASYYISEFDPKYKNVYILIYKDNKILLAETYKGFGNLGGKVDKDKTPLHAGIRELLEELFDWEDLYGRPRKQITDKLVDDIIETFLSDQQVIVYKQKINIFIFMPTQVLDEILNFIYQNPNLQSVYYHKGMPKNVLELVQNRFPGLRGFNYSGIHTSYYDHIKKTFRDIDPQKSIEDHLKIISRQMGKVYVKKRITKEVYYKPQSILFAMYYLKTFDPTKIKNFLDRNIRDPDIPMEIRSFAWVDLDKSLSLEDKRITRLYGIGLASYIHQDIGLFKMIMNDQGELLIDSKKDGIMFVLTN
jgi:hypothetical protein